MSIYESMSFHALENQHRYVQNQLQNIKHININATFPVEIRRPDSGERFWIDMPDDFHEEARALAVKYLKEKRAEIEVQLERAWKEESR